ncbi:hypothetical protein AXF42_Ash009155 [Apostasia shenzhenica]|uniref:AAA+ ATPase domain-containing protein n=1 Tax=Apostasia shenzhenica TaxID=1088818 RepID=A0A2I0ADN8_9ASPA|nr:hypothetical protein AXF42_Ash009155 [Apostasia shenzhenica]
MDSDQRTAAESVKPWLTTAAYVTASAMLARSFINELFPNELRSLVSSRIERLLRNRLAAADHTIVLRESDGGSSNELYDASITYLRTRVSPSTKRLKASKSADNNSIVVFVDDGDELVDVFHGASFSWKVFLNKENQPNGRTRELRRLELTFNRKNKETAPNSYFSHILERSEQIKSADRRLKIYINHFNNWEDIDIQHPATFQTLAVEPDLKRMIMDDLSRFLKQKECYNRIGKAWKRGYLLYGPPGTGKTSLIAAMANYLKFDIYEMELKDVWFISRLKGLMKNMKSKSILVIEDIDSAIRIPKRDENARGNRLSDIYDEITLSALLNFIDGLCSISGEERIVVFTTNYKEKLDPALLRPGRMDVHIYMGYCTPSSFRVLASNYHAIDDHRFFGEIDELLKEVEATPAEVAEEMLRSDDVDIALKGLIERLNKKREEAPGRMRK